MPVPEKSIFGVDAHSISPDISPENPDRREILVRKDLMTRLKGVCSDLSEEDFAELVAAMTREQLRSERLA